jgi:membrane associated rhomboid family serine protease
MRSISRAVLVLLVANIVVFAAQLLLPKADALLVGTGALWYPDNPNFGVWQVVSYMFLHGGISHIFFNMFALVSFGTILEREWGAGRFLVFYFLCGIGAGVIQLGVMWYEFTQLHAQLVAKGMTANSIATMLTTGGAHLPGGARAIAVELYRTYGSPTLGASGAIYGLLVAFGFLHPNAKLAMLFIPVPIAAKYFIPILLGLDLLSGVTGFSLFGGSVAHFAHLGGALIGFLLVLLWRNRRRPDWEVVG